MRWPALNIRVPEIAGLNSEGDLGHGLLQLLR